MTMNESDGPIVAAVREARAKIAQECNYDLRQLGERLREIEKKHADQMRSPKRGGKKGWPTSLGGGGVDDEPR